MRYRVDPRVVKQVVMQDGTRYKPALDGTVGVAARHEQEMAQSGARTTDHHESQILGQRIGFTSGEARICPSCAFAAWPWQRTCPRCQTSLRT